MKRYLAVLLALVLLLTGLAAIASAAPEYGGHHVWEDSGKVYYVKPDGSRVKGWYEYTMDEAGEGHWWIYGKDDGYLATGWQQLGGVWYYFSTYWGDMYTGSFYDDCFTRFCQTEIKFFQIVLRKSEMMVKIMRTIKNFI